jgi:succinate-acetate transporter protein
VTTLTRSRTATGDGRMTRRYANPEPVDEAVAAAAAPSVLGLFGLFAATVLYGSVLAGWWGGSGSPILIFPFTFMLGGLAQLVAALSALRDRDALTVAVHGIWSAFWLGFGLYELLVTTRRLPLLTAGRGVEFDFGMWFVPLAAITAAVAVAAVARSLALVAVLAPLAGASVFTAVGFTVNVRWPLTAAGWLFVVAAAAAWYLGTALLLESQHGRAVLPTGRRRSLV